MKVEQGLSTFGHPVTYTRWTEVGEGTVNYKVGDVKDVLLVIKERGTNEEMGSSTIKAKITAITKRKHDIFTDYWFHFEWTDPASQKARHRWSSNGHQITLFRSRKEAPR